MRLVVTDVTKAFGATRVLRGASLTVEEGDLAAVLGPSGCGKTTLLRIVAGFESLDTGSVRIGDREVAALPPERRKVGIVPQEAALFPHLSVARNVGFGLPRGSAERVEECLELVGLEGMGHRMPHQISGGQQQRVALARALAPRPGVVLLDEPFSALDRSLRVSVRDEVRAVLKRAGATAVLVTHDQEEALSMADVVAVMREGRIVQEDAPASVYAEPFDLGVATFVGEAVVLAATSEHGVASCELGSLPQRANGVSGRGRVALRPEQFVLREPGEGTAGLVRRVEFFGHDAAVTVVLDSETVIRARTRGDVPYRPGDRVGIAVEGPVLFFAEEEATR
ncbi:iron(III) transport system ATP-binding protein [Streptosporangium becharense]|uniref:ABC-type quaternary amine transporter n=1 Tax=Streptosporangium becharense TaxID=1816182 RepID=A0A7W9MIA3_9ACTN|nr:ABC transporter ATP-binding protein [Streptosporangium becharense]MBB2913927.1 iron(III) transport system ATP-binding protein [Streptosporangium becharense]MBB5821411.1 iron(III) transport system ATP-binding protein [Streptosporangium becharense]